MTATTAHRYGPHRPEDAPSHVDVGVGGNEHEVRIPPALIAQRAQINAMAHKRNQTPAPGPEGEAGPGAGPAVDAVRALIHPDIARVQQYRGEATMQHDRVRAAMHRFRPGQPLGWSR